MSDSCNCKWKFLLSYGRSLDPERTRLPVGDVLCFVSPYNLHSLSTSASQVWTLAREENRKYIMKAHSTSEHCMSLCETPNALRISKRVAFVTPALPY